MSIRHTAAGLMAAVTVFAATTSTLQPAQGAVADVVVQQTSESKVAPAAAAKNRTPGCVTRSEFNRIRTKATRAQVRRIVGHGGRVTSSSSFPDGDGWLSLEFRQCGKSWTYSSVSVSLEKTEREVWVSDVECYDWDGDGYEEDCEDYGSYETRYSNPMRVTSKYAYWF